MGRPGAAPMNKSKSVEACAGLPPTVRHLLPCPTTLRFPMVAGPKVQ